MYYKKKSNVIFRNFNSFGYITDNRNFEYKTTSYNEEPPGDKILSETGAVFMSVLKNKPQHIDYITLKIHENYTDVDLEIIRNDAKDFFCILEHDGFIVSGKSKKECNEKDFRFSYKKANIEEANKEFLQRNRLPEKSTQTFFDEYLQGKPLLTNLHIEIISKCNERCIHCYIPHDDKMSTMKPDLFYNILNQAFNSTLTD